MGNDNDSSNDSKNIIYENDTKHAAYISESATDTIYNSFVRIEKGNTIGTGFFMKLIINNELKHFLFTCHHVINENDIISKLAINIFYGKKNNEKNLSIKLDNKERFIIIFPIGKDVTVIEILNKDNIPENKFLTPDLNYKFGYDTYKNGKYILAGYPNDETFHKERHICSGEIKSIKEFEFSHTLDTRSGSSGAPICILNTVKVIGIHKQGHKTKPINYGTFIGVIIDELENKYKATNNNETKNEILLTLNIDEKDIGKKIYFIDNTSFHDKLKEMNKSNTVIYINGNKEIFNKYFIPQKIGKYDINLIFNFLIQDCSYMFYDCKNIESINLSSFNSQNVLNMEYMFAGCSNLNIINVSSINTKAVTKINGIFYGCESLEKINLSSFDTSNIINMSNMFSNCIKLKSINLSSFITQKVNNMNKMFCDCRNLEIVDLTSFYIRSDITMEEMFFGCDNLKEIKTNRNCYLKIISENNDFEDIIQMVD